jgi:hypothetical protein
VDWKQRQLWEKEATPAKWWVTRNELLEVLVLWFKHLLFESLKQQVLRFVCAKGCHKNIPCSCKTQCMPRAHACPVMQRRLAEHQDLYLALILFSWEPRSPHPSLDIQSSISFRPL